MPSALYGNLITVKSLDLASCLLNLSIVSNTQKHLSPRSIEFTRQS